MLRGGLTGYEPAQLLQSMAVRCDVIAPSLIPKTPGDRVKTGRRDCRKLARLHHADELTAIRIPTPREEAVRDLCRARADAVKDLRRVRQRLGMFLSRHGRVWRDGRGWTHKHWGWVRAQQFDDPALAATFAHYRGVVEGRETTLRGIDGELARWFDRAPFGEADRGVRLFLFE